MEKSNCRHLDNSGFSLVELIIGVAILSIGIVVILQAFSFSARAASLSCDMIDAVFLAEDTIQELEFNGKQSQNGSGKFEREYAVTPAPGLNLYKLSLNISWRKLGRKEEMDFNTFLRK